MATCSFCDAHAEHLIRCNYCERRHCSEHRLPENHDCPDRPTILSRGLGGDGPSIDDRRGTWTKRIERVREKETSRDNPPTAEYRQARREHEDDDTDTTNVLTCPNCGASTDRILDCGDCGQSVCPACRTADDHDCVATTEDTDDESDSTPVRESFFGRLLDLLGR
ncbi:AN1-type zinc finger domain-containing protein [Haloplanus aerogenes]|uniref:AN1-type domain-containing protein n=1 Tax=Haloplanus aerogenes TaxID=660522 RepID=A0A3G8QPL7_9EURY|nr:hypothetical protein DU502_02980 [Haloplanus aerogenes]